MRNYDAAKEIIRAMSGQTNIIGIPRAYCQFMGSLEGGALLSQVIYWSDRGGNRSWFFKTYKEWEEELMLSEYICRKWFKQMKADGYLETKTKKAHGNPTVHYKFDLGKFSETFLEFLRERNLKNSGNDTEGISDSLTEITTAITTATKKESPDGDAGSDFFENLNKCPPQPKKTRSAAAARASLQESIAQAGTGNASVADPTQEYQSLAARVVTQFARYQDFGTIETKTAQQWTRQVQKSVLAPFPQVQEDLLLRAVDDLFIPDDAGGRYEFYWIHWRTPFSKSFVELLQGRYRQLANENNGEVLHGKKDKDGKSGDGVRRENAPTYSTYFNDHPAWA